MTDEINKHDEINKLAAESSERLKELSCINQTIQILKEEKPLRETFEKICHVLQKSWQYPQFTEACITYDNMELSTPAYEKTAWRQLQPFKTIDDKKGFIQICYTKEFPEADEGPFLAEERNLIENIANIISGHINSLLARLILDKTKRIDVLDSELLQSETPQIRGRQLLQRFLNKQNYERDIFHDLMSFKVREILIVANLYDAYNIEKEGRFVEHFLGEYYQLNLVSMPRVTGVSSAEEVFRELRGKHYDMVIFMMGVDRKIPSEISAEIKAGYPYIPIFMMLNNYADIEFYEKNRNLFSAIDDVFVWNGDPKVFFAMINYVEDRVNVDNDTRIGFVRVILLVEDSAIYYSKYLPLLYSNVMQQTQRIIEDVASDEVLKVLRLRARAKILLARNYEDAIRIFDKYKDFMLCLITDVKYEKDGQLDENAGVSLVQYARSRKKDLPIIMQSTDSANADKAFDLKTIFIDKNSSTLLQDVQSFITHYLGFGNFIYKNAEGKQIAIARSLKEFENYLKIIPDDSLVYHARRDHFSLWLMARGEVLLARYINPYKIPDFKTTQELRDFLLHAIQMHRSEFNKGKVISYEEVDNLEESSIISLASGSMGGKGRGVAFINTLIYNFDFHNLIPNINIRCPKTLIIGTDEFEYFLDRNKLRNIIATTNSYEEIRAEFVKGNLGDGLIKRLRKILKLIKKPIAVRSSGLFEDSLAQPFAGIFETYLLPNSNPDFDVCLKQLMTAIKLVYASVYSKMARGYVEAINYNIEDEKMAIVLQEVVGNQYDDVFYPHISGVAQSYNYYPFGHMQPEEGVAVIAVGLGSYVVDGEKAYRFSPKYPTAENYTAKDLYKNSQLYYYAVDLGKTDVNLMEGEGAGLRKLDIDIAENQGNLKHCASVYDAESDRMMPGITHAGPRVVNFANILKYNYIPLAETIQVVLDVVKEALGTPVEIEFAIDLTKDSKNRASFYLLQIKPLLGNAMDYEIDMDSISRENLVVFAEKAMGNGKVDNISDVIYVDVEQFDKTMTEAMAEEIDNLNRKMVDSEIPYMLIGPGRWGTRDRFIGIPVNWPQISNARFIIETSLEDFPLDASSGSHFFHNVTSMNIGYFSVQPEVSNSFISWDLLAKQKLISQTKFFRHVRFEKPLTVRMDGKKRLAVVEMAM
ncbi:MAG TPA: PEP/pyruvate-binding domain-containing protein [Bacteroidales bacterium]|nr:PEP/pyruvate-binding domain-containing protein [Bacteroidales bacterium]